ncbi:uncharacterized protein LOC123322374 [Coccinella septempunctata]|uniref:uncharacterized protein LOC123322374 n=1 Tax=Coccinella septempunctata TaxID=41139 RepID=UPI001D0800EB|nr:uncharacterized protein LOC123322374 [Coccinella septempunctata]
MLHKYDQTLKSIQNTQISIKNLLTQVLDELQQLKLKKLTEKDRDGNISVFSKFKFLPINDEEHLKILEGYLEAEQNFSATIDICAFFPFLHEMEKKAQIRH